jgi:hypothetical protein
MEHSSVRVFRLQERIGTGHHSARARLPGREIAVARPSTARGNRIDMSRKAHEMRLPGPLAHGQGEDSKQTDTVERWFLSGCHPHPIFAAEGIDADPPAGRALQELGRAGSWTGQTRPGNLIIPPRGFVRGIRTLRAFADGGDLSAPVLQVLRDRSCSSDYSPACGPS